MVRKPWELSFLAEPQEVAGLRRVVRLHLGFWGLSRQIDTAQLCVSELVSRVIREAGTGAPTSLRLLMSGTSLRIEVRGPSSQLPPPTPGASADMGMVLVEGFADRWGVVAEPEHRVTWCEIGTDLTTSDGHSGGARVTRAEAMLSLYGAVALPQVINGSRLAAAVASDVVVQVIVDLLHWVEAHGYDADDVLDVAQARFDAGL
ncbi:MULTISPECIES: ATP-binding protein [unclassified Streptomyces]|uniref:ATP-binding protein n=1 Tax=unclassified Streptomyces TaxID=2593676 RepID=UPI00166066B3|nr:MULTISPECIES: ATP-binding protein [unclassified Streptomyces]MBD0709849.1 ATP-binding protein [Streptomyces sp. CBMA291]MBD0715053.1 ATP-binding protein [Streptomyces sp. CBMA370]